MNDQTALDLTPDELIAAYRQRRFDDLSRELLEILAHFRRRNYHALGPSAQHFLDVFVKHFLYLFTQEDYVPSERDMASFIELNLVIGNLVALSSFRTTDAYLEILKGQKLNFAKLLALLSARNRSALERRVLFDTEPAAATQWYFCYWENYKTCCAEEGALARLREHLRFRDTRMGAINQYVHHAYFGCTYADPERDWELKLHINRTFQQWKPARLPIVNRPDRRKVAVVTAMWFPAQSVYRCTYSFVRALAAEFDLTLVHLGPERGDLDTTLFREVRRFQMNLPAELKSVTPNDWGIVYFPDIGMNIESIFLSNLRLAPIQICGYGHPVSTFGSRVDYWLGGRDIESLEDHERNYSERLVLVPGSGVAPNRPNYTLKGLYRPGETVVINCPWSAQKVNYPLLECLRRILDGARRRVRCRFFTGGSLMSNSFLPFRRDLERTLGAERVEVFDSLPYPEYMAVMEQGDFSLDSFPFGGYATATDALYLRQPMLTQQGTKFFNRSAASLLRRVGLEELIVSEPGAYEAMALRLIDDQRYRGDVRARLAAVDLERSLFSHDDAKYVVEAFHYLLDHHDQLKQDGHRQPIVIGA
jgi:hypothetical protein